MLSAEIRRSFLNFFNGREHLVLPSSSLVPHSDPSLLLTNAGMVQFKAYYAGLAEPPSKRVATVQKCFRTSDLEEVGDESHLTFFEMLGNFSFGDYFKEGAIELAWEYLTRELSLDSARLHPAVHPSDDEAAAIWRRVWGGEPQPLDDNYWPASLEGWVGPCGPDSEIYFDWGPSVGCGRSDCHPGHCERYLELWNLVFPQFERSPAGEMRPLVPPGIDTGMGLERLTAVVNGVPGIHETDVFAALNLHLRDRGRPSDPDGAPAAYARRLCADHARATAFLVADGVRPGNEGRGYVLRKMVRRATLHGVRRLGIEDALSGAVELVAELMGDAYPEVLRRSAEIQAVLAGEEASFRRTLETGEREFETIAARSRGMIAGEDAFKLHDTYGFPVELTAELGAERGLKVDRQGFTACLEEQRRMSRRGARRNPAPRTGLPATEFLGHETLAANGVIVRMFHDDREVNEAGDGEEVEVYLDRSPMYAEAGGQVGDIGLLEGGTGTIEVRDVQKQGAAHAHYGTVVSGTVRVGDQVQATVDHDARWSTMRHHSATHLLHRALREVLGEGATQAGSYVAPDSCTFDFTFARAMEPSEVGAVFSMVNSAVREDLPRVTREMSLADATRSGAMHLFGEKYGDVVRVVTFGEFSSELCGGTHVDRSGQVGLVIPLSERSVGAGVRRIEFLAGARAEQRIHQLTAAALAAASALNVPVERVGARLEQVLDERRRLQKDIEELRRKALSSRPAAAAQAVSGLAFQAVDSADPALLRDVADRNLDAEREAKVALVVGSAGSQAVVVVKTRTGSGASAQLIFRRLVEIGGGRGGGNERLAQGGGFDPTKTQEMVRVASEMTAGLPGPGAADPA